MSLRFRARAFSSCDERGSLFITVHGPLTVAASPVVEHRLQMHRLSSCGSRAQPLRGMWVFPDQGSNPCPLHWQADSQPLRHQGSPIVFLFFHNFLLCYFIPFLPSFLLPSLPPSLPLSLPLSLPSFSLFF